MSRVTEHSEARKPVKSALLIGSSHGELPGTENDVDTMVRILQRYGFDSRKDIKRLCGSEATRQNILEQWNDIASEKTKTGDVVVIYYSGHGGLAEPPERENNSTREKEQQPDRIQFLVPHGFDDSLERWEGILDSEISLLLLKTTRRTSNVTFILDCCHSARLGRAPNGTDAPRPKVLKYDYSVLFKHMKRLRSEKRLLENEFWSNPDVVRIAAAGDREAAWQYKNSSGQDVGIMTEKLDYVMRGGEISWRSIMLGVKALVEVEFPKEKDSQQPRSAGTDIRTPFSLTRKGSNAFLAVVGDSYTIIEGGRVHGINRGDEFTLIPFHSQSEIDATSTTAPDKDFDKNGIQVRSAQRNRTNTITAKVTSVNGFTAMVSKVSKTTFRTSLALALPIRRHNLWPIWVPSNLGQVKELLSASGFFRTCESKDEAVLEFRQDVDNQEKISLYGRGHSLGSRRLRDQSDIENLLSVAHIYAQSRAILSIEGGEDDEEFSPNIEIELGTVCEYEKLPQVQYKIDSEQPPKAMTLAVGDKYYIHLKYKCGQNNDSQSETDHVYVSVFSVDAAGKTTLVTRAWEKGLDLSRTVKSRLLAAKSFPLEGLSTEWPISVPRRGQIRGSFVFVLTHKPIDLRCLEASSSLDFMIARGEQASLVASRQTSNPYTVVRIPYSLEEIEQNTRTDANPTELISEVSQPSTMASSLQSAKTFEEEKDLYDHLRGTAAEEKSGFGRFARFVKRVPPYVWVINQHDEEITVVLKKYSPNRQLSSIGVDLSIPGAGLNFDFTTFVTDGTEKTLMPQHQDPDRSIAAFPFWTREDGFGIISIFTGPDKKPCILNDQVRMGARVYFRGGPNLFLED